jgi:hypothetical protein
MSTNLGTPNRPAAVDTSEILNEWHKEILSQDAQKVYTAVWLRMNSLRATEIHLTDEDLSRRARVVLPRIHAAKVELARQGLLRLSPIGDRIRYEYVDVADTREVEAEATQ